MKKVQNKYSIRKFNTAVGSVIVGTAIFFGGQAHAAENEVQREQPNVEQAETTQEVHTDTLQASNEEVVQNNQEKETAQNDVSTQATEQPRFITNTDFKTQTDENGQTPIWSKQQVNYEWNATGYKKGDEINFNLPEQLRLANEQNFDLNTPDNVNIGRVNATRDGLVNVSLTDPTDYLATHENTKGWMYFETMFNRDKVKAGESYNIKLGNKGYTVDVAQNEINKSPLQKWGYVDDDNKVRWDVRINQDEQTINNGRLEDTLGDGLTFDEDSLTVTEFDVDNQELGSPFYDYKLTPTTNGFTIDFLKQINKAYEIEYTTTPLLGTNHQYTNSVELTGDGYKETLENVESEVSNAGGGGEGDNIPPVEPEQPTEPELPKEPETPEEPTTPNVPEEPNTPEQPNNPEKPEKPEEPNKPEQPTKSEEPKQPQPETPQIPEQSEVKEKHEEPKTPTGKEGTPITPQKPSKIVKVENKEEVSPKEIQDDTPFVVTRSKEEPKRIDKSVERVTGNVANEQELEKESKEAEKVQEKELPKTGQAENIGVFGLLALVTGIALVRRRNKED